VDTISEKECLWELHDVASGVIIRMNGDCTVISEEVSSEKYIKADGDLGIFLMMNGDVLVVENTVFGKIGMCEGKFAKVC
jgi:hypothetical protein